MAALVTGDSRARLQGEVPRREVALQRRSSAGAPKTFLGWRLVAAIGSAALVSGCWGTGHFARPTADSVLLIDIDTLRADGLGCYGNPRDSSPAMDRLASEGVRFEWALAQAPNTPPSQASILTGLYPSRHGRMDDFDAVRPEVVTLAESLRGAGLRTAAFVDGGFMAPGFGLEQGFETYDDAAGAGIRETTRRGLAWLDGVGKEPYFLLLHAYDVHTPYAPPEPYRARFAAMVSPPTPGFEPTSELLESIRKRHPFDPSVTLPRRDVDFARALYDGEVRFVDDQIRDLLLALERRGLAGRTIVVVTSDHGEEFLEHGSVLHEKLYAPVLRVPLLIRAPAMPTGLVVPSVVQTVDLVPTLLDLLGLAVTPGLDGQSLAEAVRGGSSPRRAAFAESPFFSQERSLAAGGWRYLYRRDRGAGELYRFREDPAEAHDLAADEPAVAERLRSALDSIERRLETSRRGLGTGAEVSEETVRQLRALGYLQ